MSAWRIAVYRQIVAGVAGLTLAVGLSGCFNGYQAQTSTQGEGGNVASANVGDVQLRGLIWVTDPSTAEGDEPATTAYLSGTAVVGTGGAPDELVGIEVPGGSVALSGEPVAVAADLPAVLIGFNGTAFATATDVEIPSSGFVPTVFKFKNAGDVEVDVLSVPGVGSYAQVVKDSKAGAG